MVNFILKTVPVFCGQTIDIPRLAFQLAEGFKSEHPSNKDTALDGGVLICGFRKSHPELSVRTPEAAFAVKSQPFNKKCE